MHPVLTPQRIATEPFTDADAAVARLIEIYERNTRFLRDSFEAYVNGEVRSTRVRATYPFVRILISTHARLNSRLSYGFVAGPGIHETTVTRPDLFRTYLTEQIRLLIENHGVPVEIGESSEPIPIHFAYRRDINVEAGLSAGAKLSVVRPLRDVFDTPDLAAMDDAIANGTLKLPTGTPEPLALFRAAHVDYSLHRLYHYTRTDPEHFQNFVIFTNYQFYVDMFARLSRERMVSGHAELRCLCRAWQCDYPQCSPGRWDRRRCPGAYASNACPTSGRTRQCGIEQELDAAESCDRALGHVVDFGPLGDVDLDSQRPAAVPIVVRSRFASAFLVDIGANDIGAFACKDQRSGATNAAGCTGDNDGLSCKIVPGLRHSLHNPNSATSRYQWPRLRRLALV